MSEPAPATWRHDLILDELAAIGLDMVRDLRERIAATDDAQEALKLIGGLNQTARSVRQGLALQARLFRELRGFERARIDERRALNAARSEQAKDKVRARVRQALWNEYERWDYNRKAGDLDLELLRLDCEAGPVEDFVTRLCRKLGVTPTQVSASGLSRGPMDSVADYDPATVPTHQEPPADMDPRDKPEGDDRGWVGVPEPIPRRSSA